MSAPAPDAFWLDLCVNHLELKAGSAMCNVMLEVLLPRPDSWHAMALRFTQLTRRQLLVERAWVWEKHQAHPAWDQIGKVPLCLVFWEVLRRSHLRKNHHARAHAGMPCCLACPNQ